MKIIVRGIVKYVVLCAAAYFAVLSCTVMRAAQGSDKEKNSKQAADVEEVADRSPVPVKTYAIPEKHKYLFMEVETKEDVPKIHLKEAKLLFESGEALFIDARSQEEYNQSHIAGSLYIGADDSPKKIKAQAELLKGKVLVTYCHGVGCHLSDKTAFNLFDAGYRKIAIFFGGWPEWTQASLPIEKYQLPEQFKHLLEEAVSVQGVKNVSLEEAKFLYDNNLAIFIDVDYKDKYNEISIARSINIPIDKIDEMLPGHEGYLNQKTVVVYCHSGDSKLNKAVGKMFKAGHKKMLRFVDAMPQWEKAGYPLFRSSQQGKRKKSLSINV
ncbi:MAG: rhodanese-like domain-containing protein [Spirochaetota bacterium]